MNLNKADAETAIEVIQLALHKLHDSSRKINSRFGDHGLGIQLRKEIIDARTKIQYLKCKILRSYPELGENDG